MRQVLMLLGVMALTACGRQPTKEELAEAKTQVKSFLDSAEHARRAAELLGLLPEYECGEARGSFVAHAADGLRSQTDCATVTVESTTDADLVHVTLAESGCTLKGLSAKGKATFRYSGGESRMEVEADFRELRVAGETLPVRAGYGTCGDEKRYWVLAEGTVPQQSDRTYKLDTTLSTRGGLPIIGGSTFILDGQGELKKDAADRVTFIGLTYDLGQYLPKDGTLRVETAGGRKVEATFRTTLWRLGEVEVSVDDSEPTTLPIVR
jgi:hypothetical protein